MHEMALCESILQVLEEEAEAGRFAKVRSVRLEVGPLAGVELEALRFGFEVVARGTLAEGARLDIVATEGAAWCFSCGRAVTMTAWGAPCPQCGGWELQVTSGRELRIKDLEVE
jgi:hydrogenase nickel incorporation protein HypA/HybF